MDFQVTPGALGRAMRQALPDNVSISFDARNDLTRLVNTFIVYLTVTAQHEAKVAKRPFITGDHVMAAVESIGFDALLEPLFEHLQSLRQDKDKDGTQRDKQGQRQGGEGKEKSSRKRAAKESAAKQDAGASAAESSAVAATGADGSEPATKHVRLDESVASVSASSSDAATADSNQ